MAATALLVGRTMMEHIRSEPVRNFLEHVLEDRMKDALGPGQECPNLPTSLRKWYKRLYVLHDTEHKTISRRFFDDEPYELPFLTRNEMDELADGRRDGELSWKRGDHFIFLHALLAAGRASLLIGVAINWYKRPGDDVRIAADLLRYNEWDRSSVLLYNIQIRNMRFCAESIYVFIGEEFLQAASLHAVRGVIVRAGTSNKNGHVVTLMPCKEGRSGRRRWVCCNTWKRYHGRCVDLDEAVAVLEERFDKLTDLTFVV